MLYSSSFRISYSNERAHMKDARMHFHNMPRMICCMSCAFVRRWDDDTVFKNQAAAIDPFLSSLS